MTLAEIQAHNARIVAEVWKIKRQSSRIVARRICDRLNDAEMLTTRGHAWTTKSLYRMLARQGRLKLTYWREWQQTGDFLTIPD